MAKVKLFIASSLDGFIAGKDGDISWLFTSGDFGYTAFFDSVAVTLSGYETYKVTLSFGEPFPNAGKTNYVFTRKNRPDAPFVTFINRDPAEFTRELKQTAEGDIWLIGGGEINAILARAGLIDEIILSVHPVWLGEGIPLFGKASERFDLKLMATTVFPEGLVQFIYSFVTKEVGK